VDGGKKIDSGCGSGKRADPYQETKSAECHHCRASTLQQDEEQAGETDDPGPALESDLMGTVDR
jgi:hypothetical protein